MSVKKKPEIGELTLTPYWQHPRYRGCVGHWLLNDYGGVRVSDVSGFGNHGTAQNITPASDWICTAHGPSLHFDGTNNVVVIPTPKKLQVDLPVAWSAWVYMDNLTTRNALFNTSFDNVIYRGFWVELGTDGGIGCHFGDGDQNNSSDRRTKSAPVSTLSTGQWYALAGNIRGATDMDIFVNGVDVGGTYSGTGGPMVWGTDNMHIGEADRDSGSNEFFAGVIENLRIYNRTLTTREVISLYTDPYLEFQRPIPAYMSVPAAAGLGIPIAAYHHYHHNLST